MKCDFGRTVVFSNRVDFLVLVFKISESADNVLVNVLIVCLIA